MDRNGLSNSDPVLRVGWACTLGTSPFSGSGVGSEAAGAGDDFSSFAFDGQHFCFGAIAAKKLPITEHVLLLLDGLCNCSHGRQ